MLDKDTFLEKYPLEEALYNSGVSWELLNSIYDDYIEKQYDRLSSELKKILELLQDQKPENLHVIYGRVKKPEHLIEKIVRKAGIENIEKYKKISLDNYKDIVTDLVGVRILVLDKEEWKIADTHIRNKFNNTFEQEPTAYVCYGDRDIFDRNIINVMYTNKGYRSQHYIIKPNVYYVEIQVRTLAEEVYGEFDHSSRYPYRNNNKFLLRYSKIVSKTITELDDLISTGLHLDDILLDELDHHFEEDQYIDWDKKIGVHCNGNIKQNSIDLSGLNNAKDLANYKILRKGE